MNTQRKLQLEYIKRVANRLDSLVERFVFVGGATIGLLLTEEGAPDVRETKDVDIIVEVIGLPKYYQIASQLRALGFKENKDLICRWVVDDITVDCMPTDEKILGFSNKWYREAIQYANDFKIEKDLVIRLISAPYLIATKLEAFYGRGRFDYMASHDLTVR